MQILCIKRKLILSGAGVAVLNGEEKMPKGIYKRLHLKNCKVKNCNKKYFSLGYCLNHYANNNRTGHPLGKFRGNKEAFIKAFKKRKMWEINRVAFICKIKNCGKKHYAKSYCQNHYEMLIMKGGYRLHKCKIKNCIYKTHKVYCCFHQSRFENNLPMNLNIDYRHLRIGKKNNLWRGGIAEYPNHYLMKKNRLIILLHNPICEICNRKPAVEVHHKDSSKTNHFLSNLQAVCHKCNTGLRIQPNIRFLSIYGITKEKIAKRLKINPSQCMKLHTQNKLLKALKD